MRSFVITAALITGMALPASADTAPTASQYLNATASTQGGSFGPRYRPTSAWARREAQEYFNFRTFLRAPNCPHYAGVMHRGNQYCFKKR